MKKMFLSFFIMVAISSSAYSEVAELSSKNAELNIEAFKLFNGRVIKLKESVHKVYFFKGKLDFVELKDREVIDRTDIISIKRNDESKETFAAAGVDGGG